MEDLDEVVREFLIESGENLDHLDEDLLALEREPWAVDRLSSAFRTVHTIKGTCAALGFVRLESVAHAGEALLAGLRDGELAFEHRAATALLALGDAIRTMPAGIERCGAEPDQDYQGLIAGLQRLTHGRAAGGPPAVAGAELGEAPRGPPPRVRTTRVETALLDSLLALAGELVAARDQIVQQVHNPDPSGLAVSARRLDIVTRDLREGLLRTRRQPVGTAWTRIPRLVRDLALTLGKQVEVVTSGDEIDVDPAIVEALRDPLVHMVRNAVDHGIERPEVRVAAGKPPRGTVTVQATVAGRHLVIDVRDDGSGVDTRAVLARAVETGLLTPATAARLDADAALQLLFVPGFTTAPAVTNVSGRGVGMDVVHTDVDRIGGSVQVLSQLRFGTTMRTRIPLVLPRAEHPAAFAPASRRAS